MFTNRTVFIIGAGASAEVDLPTGTSLQAKIAESLRFQYESDDELKSLVMTAPGDGDFRARAQACRRLAPTITTFPSIDEALHWWRDDALVVRIGKLAIAHTILNAEKESSLYPAQTSGRVDAHAANGTWLDHFFSMALSGLGRRDYEQAFKRTTIINFNYDRVVEHYLFHALQQRSGLDPTEAAQCVSQLHVIRPYGSLGKLPWELPNIRRPVPFGGEPTHEMASEIFTFTESRDEEGGTTEMKNALRGARAVLILGFGFHRQNVAMLQRDAPSPADPVVEAITFATMSGIDIRNKEAIEREVRRIARVGSEFPAIEDLKAGELMSRLRPRIMTAVSG